AIAPRKDLGVENAGEVTFIGSVNDTPAIDGGERYFQSDLYVYRWTDRRGEHCKSTAKDVLAEFGFNTYWGTSRRRVPSVVLINVKTNVPDWLGAAGKTHINQVPYGETIAKALCVMSHNIPSYRGQGYAMVCELSGSVQKSAEEYLDDFLRERRKEIEADPSLRITDRLTQRGIESVLLWWQMGLSRGRIGVLPESLLLTTFVSIASSCGLMRISQENIWEYLPIKRLIKRCLYKLLKTNMHYE
ncbi:MAG: hypothetical protein WCC17_22345, partial [Candidatus Nitrosopolaris sp.]